jgi:DNA mismatch repair protein MutS2
MLKEFMTENCKKNINFDFIFDEIKPITKYGINCKKNAKPFVQGQEKDVELEFDKLEAFLKSDKRREIIDILKQIRYIGETLQRAKGGVVLDEVELFEVKKLLIYIEKLEKSLKSTPMVKYKDLKLQELSRLYKLLDPANQQMMTFYLYSEYSDELKKIRGELRTVEIKISKIKKELINKIEQKYNIKLNTREEVTVNKSLESKINELSQEEHLRISGENYLSLIYKLKNNHDLDELKSELEKLKLRENEEEHKIRKFLTDQIAKSYDEIVENTDKIGRIDYLIAKANFAQKSSLVRPQISSELIIDIKNGRNLKLEDALKQKKKKYTSISVNLSKKIICITGANMGGKTVSLRMIGQIVSTAAYGIFVPCESSKICLFDHIHISVGDEQSIEKGLSTFGAEIVNLKEALENANKRSLILIDELAGGTNPKEGFAITKAVVEYLKNSNSMSILTTHYDNIAQDNEIQNFQVKGLNLPDYFKSFSSIEEISKFMDYSLIEVKDQNFVPKDAISIAKMAGIPQEIIEKATQLIEH